MHRAGISRPGASCRLAQPLGRKYFVSPFASEAIAFVCWFFYSSYFEWFVHRHLMHVRRPFPLQEAFKGHTLVHHQLYHWNGKFEATGPGRPPHVALRWYAFPVMIALHVPLFYLIQYLVHVPVVFGSILGTTLYFAGYEYTHYLMHVPKGHPVERYRWFKFLKGHHRLHHKYYLRNLNVFLPLGDLAFGTLVTSEGWRSKPTKRQRFLSKRKADLRAKTLDKTGS